MSWCLHPCKHILILHSTLCDLDLAEYQHWETGGTRVTNATKGNKTASLDGGVKQRRTG